MYYTFAGGHFVCKVFDMFTPYSVGLFYLLYRSFDKVCIFKPVTSRPANSERYMNIYLEWKLLYLGFLFYRYIICCGFKPNISAVGEYLLSVNKTMLSLRKEHPEKDVLHVRIIIMFRKEVHFTSFIHILYCTTTIMLHVSWQELHTLNVKICTDMHLDSIVKRHQPLDFIK